MCNAFAKWQFIRFFLLLANAQSELKFDAIDAQPLN